jgi:hypothetical protein
MQPAASDPHVRSTATLCGRADRDALLADDGTRGPRSYRDGRQASARTLFHSGWFGELPQADPGASFWPLASFWLLAVQPSRGSPPRIAGGLTMTLRTLMASAGRAGRSRANQDGVSLSSVAHETTSPQASIKPSTQRVVCAAPGSVFPPAAVSSGATSPPQAPFDSTPRSSLPQSNHPVARAASPAVSTSSDETAQHGVGVEGVHGVATPRGVSSRLAPSGSSHHSVAQVALNRTQGNMSRITKSLALFVSKNRKLTVLGFAACLRRPESSPVIAA